MQVADCPAGKYCPLGKSSSETSPTDCGTSFGFNERPICKNCAFANSLNKWVGPSEPRDCPEGFYCPPGSENEPQKCLEKKHCPSYSCFSADCPIGRSI
jgi:hypothetical protein